MSKKSNDPCQSKACDIQSCLEKNNYDEEKCMEAMIAMFECCKQWRKQSNACSGFNSEVIDKKLKEYHSVLSKTRD